MSISDAYKAFKEEKIEEVILASTMASWNGNICYLKLFPDGNYRTIHQLGNRYDSPGAIIGVPSLSDEEWDEENGHFFENAIEQMDLKFKQWLLENG